MIRVAIADDQAMVRTGFRMIVGSQTDMEVAGEAGDGQAAIDLVRREATRTITGAGLPTRVVILTTYELDEYVFDALAAGASAFLLKAAPPEDLIRAIRVVASGDALLAPSVTRRLIEEFAKRPEPPARKAKQLDALTEREREVLRELAGGFTNAEIAARLHVAETTVKTHVAHVLDKLELRDRVQAVILAYEAGLAGG